MLVGTVGCEAAGVVDTNWVLEVRARSRNAIKIRLYVH